jgi:hypothetical protein
MFMINVNLPLGFTMFFPVPDLRSGSKSLQFFPNLLLDFFPLTWVKA